MGDFDYSTHYRYAALMLCPLALFGFTCNLIVVLFIRKMPSLTNSFGNLTLSQALADTCHQAIFAFYFAPCLLLSVSGYFKHESIFKVVVNHYIRRMPLIHNMHQVHRRLHSLIK
ncbi:hypothetical protein PMAYCL1PPCAC_09441 [Pristionchus mayeri]|uniref:7TM GPCR serpentine receptor class x (Srx) domain-containing protein n=1 Tax=Pristionchus mayeri TaxID=1317129 RepID=A0AAN5CEV6_9BILA|nr:hypothetical protein PMAYCL1PPCAC_09441 [Pristionchus mayeri]